MATILPLFPGPKKAAERHDTGRVARGRRWFSARTMREAGHYHDVGWLPVVMHLAASGALVTVSRLYPAESFAPFALVAGLVWLFVAGRVGLLKAFSALVSHRHRAG